MKTRIFTDNWELDISNVRLSTQESNSKVSDQMFTKFTLPFEVYITEEISKKLGDYASFTTKNLKNKVDVFLEIEGKTHEAVLFILSQQGLKLFAQIDYGFEEIPNFSKKLSEIPYEKFSVPDIHVFAKTIAEKKWPQTNFNFPRVFTKKYAPTGIWSSFDGYINDLKTDGTEMRRNYIDGTGNIFNINIIQPLPHLLYLLCKGFADAGYQLEGGIMQDPLLDRWVFSGTQYFTTLQQRKSGLQISSFQNTSTIGPYLRFDYNIPIEKSGKYKITGVLQAKKKGSTNFNNLSTPIVSIFLNGTQIFSKQQNADIYEVINIDVNCGANSTLTFFAVAAENNTAFYNIFDVQVISDALDATNEPGEESGVVTNLNEIDLRRAVPDITFGDLVNTIRNWFNYDIDILGKTVIMNKIVDANLQDAKDATFLEIPEPKRNFLNKKSFLLKFPDLDEGNKKDNMFFDVSGPLLNGKENANTTIISINGYALPIKLPKPGGYNTANVLKDATDLLQLVDYKGLQSGQNNAIYTPVLDFPQLFTSNWEKWLKQRINGQELSWTKNCSISEISKINIKDYIFCYQNLHIIKTMEKEVIAENTYSINITTETVV